MLDYAKIKETLKSLITDTTSQEDVEKIGNIAAQLDQAEADSNSLLEKHEELRQKYMNAVKNSAFSDIPKEEKPDAPKSLEECIQDVIDKRK